ncbi:MAG: ABC transporter ATP-binding protein/permease [Clostridia bacterium]|nr:ABC transporter ATP-binding protein/permease [Clostridia bacterium]
MSLNLFKKKNDAKQSFFSVFDNNRFFIKMMFSASPSYVIYTALDGVRNELSIFLEHTLLIGYVLEAAEFNYPFKRVGLIILIAVLLISLGMVFTVYAGNYVAEKERPKVREGIKLKLYEKARSVDLECYDNPEFYNELVLSISEVDNRIDRVSAFLRGVCESITVLVTTGIYFLTKDGRSIIFVLVSFILMYIFSLIYNRLNYNAKISKNPHERERDYVKRVFYLNDYAKEVRLNTEVSEVLLQKFENANDEVYRSERRFAGKKFIVDFVRKHIFSNMLGDVFYISYLIYLATVPKTIALSALVILFNSFNRAVYGLKDLTDCYSTAAETGLYVQKIRNFLDYKLKVVSHGDAVPTASAKKVELKNVSFAYSSNPENVIKDISLTINPGEKVALVGYNGAGKTTLVKLLMRLYDVTEGAVLADGIDIRDYNLNKYRDSIGAVFQDFEIFAASITENVIMEQGDKADKDRVDKALKDSGLYDRVLTLKDKSDTQITNEFFDDGVNLSGGENQKLAASRVFYKDNSLMILDEPSSALDPISEYQLNQAMLKATSDKTVIFISHRLSTTRFADRIIMLENGKIVESGSHDELLKQNGKYAAMWKAQAGAYIKV